MGHNISQSRSVEDDPNKVVTEPSRRRRWRDSCFCTCFQKQHVDSFDVLGASAEELCKMTKNLEGPECSVESNCDDLSCSRIHLSLSSPGNMDNSPEVPTCGIISDLPQVEKSEGITTTEDDVPKTERADKRNGIKVVQEIHKRQTVKKTDLCEKQNLDERDVKCKKKKEKKEVPRLKGKVLRQEPQLKTDQYYFMDQNGKVTTGEFISNLRIPTHNECTNENINGRHDMNTFHQRWLDESWQFNGAKQGGVCMGVKGTRKTLTNIHNPQKSPGVSTEKNHDLRAKAMDEKTAGKLVEKHERKERRNHGKLKTRDHDNNNKVKKINQTRVQIPILETCNDAAEIKVTRERKIDFKRELNKRKPRADHDEKAELGKWKPEPVYELIRVFSEGDEITMKYHMNFRTLNELVEKTLQLNNEYVVV